MTSPPRVLIAYSYSMHYRLGVFRALLEASEAEVTIAVGDTVAAHAAQLVQPIDPAELPEMQVHRTRAWRSLRWQPTLLRESLSPRYDVVIWDPSLHCLTMWASSVLLRARGRTLLYWGLGWTRSHGRVKEQAKVWGFRLAHAFLTYGHRSRQRAVAAGYPADRLYVVGNSIVDTPQAAVVAREEMLPAQPLVLGTSVRLSARKRVDLLIEAAAVLQRSGTAVRVRIVGDGPQRAGLEALAARCGVEVDFLGPLYEPDAIADFYRSIHLTVLPGHAGLTVLQSLMHGRPVVTHDDPDHHAAEWEALHEGHSGAFFVVGDLADLGRTIGEVAGWIERDAAAVASDCRADYLAFGDPAAHAERILHAVHAMVERLRFV